MQSDNKFFDDLAKLGQSAFGTLHGVKGEVETLIRSRLEQALADMNLVTREEFEVVRDMARQAREKNAELEQKIAALETSLKPKTPPKTPPKTTGKKPTKTAKTPNKTKTRKERLK